MLSLLHEVCRGIQSAALCRTLSISEQTLFKFPRWQETHTNRGVEEAVNNVLDCLLREGHLSGLMLFGVSSVNLKGSAGPSSPKLHKAVVPP